ncbi:hypothetical protein O0L34_g1809 [Tuta absoluta]|nr:hypothetical protein O0L34_g1809 [Tuta absoluta]
MPEAMSDSQKNSEEGEQTMESQSNPNKVQTVRITEQNDADDNTVPTSNNNEKYDKANQITKAIEDCESNMKYHFAKPRNQYPFQYKKRYQQKTHPYSQNVVILSMFKKEAQGDDFEYADEDTGDRNAFVRKVMVITGVMLMVTIICVNLAIFVQSVREFLNSTIGLIILGVCSIGHFLIGYIWCCVPAASRSPWCWILCVLETIFFSYIAMFIAERYGPYVVLAAALTTLAITLLCLGLAYTSFDFTKYLLIVIAASFALFFVSMIFVVLQYALGIKLSILRIVILFVSAILTSVMLVIEFQTILGGKSVQIGTDDYCYAAYSVYTSIVQLFVTLIQLMGYAMSEN